MKNKVLAVRALPLLLFLAVLGVSGSVVLADELLKFKSGYEMMVVSHREEGGMIIVTLDGGGQVGFPKDVLDLMETGKPTTRSGPSPLFNKVPSRVHIPEKVQVPVQSESELPSRFLARGLTSANGARVGYSMHGQEMQRFSGGPIEAVNANGKVGVDIRTRGKIRNHDSPAENGRVPGITIRTQTMDAIVPSSKEGE